MATGESGDAVEAAQGSQRLAPSPSLEDLASGQTNASSQLPDKKELTRTEAIELIRRATGLIVGVRTLEVLESRVLTVNKTGKNIMITVASLERVLRAMEGYEFLDVTGLAEDLRTSPQQITPRLEQLAAEDGLVRALGRRVRGEQAWQESERRIGGQEFYVLAAGKHDELVIKLLEGVQRTAYPAAYVDAMLAIQLGIKPDSDPGRNIKLHFLGGINLRGVYPAYSAGVVDGFFASVRGHKSLDYKAIRDKLGKPEIGLFLNLLDLESQQPDGVILKLSSYTRGTKHEYFLRRGVGYEELANKLAEKMAQLAQASQAPA